MTESQHPGEPLGEQRFGDAVIRLEHRHTPTAPGRPHTILAWHGDVYAGMLTWHEAGRGINIGVEESYQRRGLASAMWRHAKRITPGITHSRRRAQTDAGAAWAAAVGN